MTARRFVVLALSVLVVALFVPGSALAEPNDGVVEGSVTNASANGQSPAGDDVIMLQFSVAAQSQVGELTTKVGPDGSYRFENVDRNPDFAYYVIVVHQSVSYPSATPFQLKEATSQRADVRVYDSTTQDNVLRYERLNLLVADAEPGMLQVFQMGAVVNTSDRTFIPANPQDGFLARAIKFPLPEGALEAQFQTGFRDEDRQAAVGGIQVTTPLKPGRQEYAIAFMLPYTGTEADLSVQLPYPADAVQVYAPETGAKLQSANLESRGRGDFGGQQFALYGANGVSAGTKLGARLTGLASGGGSAFSPNQLALFSLGAIALVVGAGFLVLGRGRRMRATATPKRSQAPEGDAAEPDDERVRLVVKLAMLDERFAAGEIGESDYQRQRAREKQRLLELAETSAAS
ncbi:MAG: SHOCT domain-containing protein [Chloroflexi bacterium]|nr:SHOCT domain-containing protein [Chloroflexota bacterium]